MSISSRDITNGRNQLAACGVASEHKAVVNIDDQIFMNDL